MLGGPVIAGATLVAIFRAACLRDSGMLIGFVCLHLLMVLKLGINEWRCQDVSMKKPPTPLSITN